jgi:hypothetical protein
MYHNGNNRRRTPRDPIAIMEALLHDVSVQAAEDYESTAEDDRWANATVAKLHRQLDQLGPARDGRPGAAWARQDVEIPDSIRALDRATVLAQLEFLRQRGHVRYANQNLTGMSVNDLHKTLAVVLGPQEPQRDQGPTFAASPWLCGIELARLSAAEWMDRSAADTPEEYAAWRGVALRDTRLDGTDGQLVVGPRGAYILLADHLSHRARRWTIAHELGHYELVHPAAPAGELCRPAPRSWRRERWERDYEDEANQWSLAATMRDSVVARFCDRMPLTLDDAGQLAETCGVPLGAAAIRLTETTFRVCAVVVSLHGVIQGMSPSLRFLMLANRSQRARISPGNAIPWGSVTRTIYDTRKRQDQPVLVRAEKWFDGMSPRALVQEHAVPLDQPGCVLTMLSTPSDVDAERDLNMTPHATAFVRDYLLSSERALTDFNKRFGSGRQRPRGVTWLDSLMRSDVPPTAT